MKKKMSEDTQTMIQHALDQDWNKANKVFGDMMSTKLQDVLDQEKIKLADQIYNGAEEIEDDEVELDDDQLEMDLEDEGDDGEEGEEGELPLEDAEEGIQEPSDNVELEMGDEDGEGEEDPNPEES
tara:strand:+ start:305 stop:682 length:378 start_codon:yes stop_codon:yes gene_type:complete